jgi:hypothetical protein
VLASTVTGYVYDQATGNPIAGAIVYAGTSISAETDATGAYTLTGVPSGNVCFTAIPPYSGHGNAASVVTSASHVDFWLMPSNDDFAAYSVLVHVSNEAGAPISGAYINFYNNNTSIGAGITDSNGRKACSNVYVHEEFMDKLLVLASKAGTGCGYAKDVTVTAGVTTEVFITIRTPATVSGTITDTSGTYVAMMVEPGVVSDSNWNAMFALMNFCSGGSYSDLLAPPPNSAADSILLVGIGAVTTETTTVAYGCSFVPSTPTPGSTMTQNFTLKGVPRNLTYSTQEAGDLIYVTMTWEAPADWAPSYYIASYGGSYIFVNDTTVTFPLSTAQFNYWMSQGDNDRRLVWAIESTSSFSFDSVTFSGTSLDKGSYVIQN